MKFRNIAAITIGTIAMATTTFCASNINVTLNGLAISFGYAKPEIINGRTMVPVRGLFEKMGYSIKWDSATRTATLTSNENTITCSETKLTKTDKGTEQTTTVQSDVLPQIVNNRFYLPLRSVANAADCNVDWDSASKTVKISYISEAMSNGSGSISSSTSSNKITSSTTKKEKTEEEKMEAQATFMNPEGDITTSADTYFKTVFPLLQQLKTDCLSSNNPVFEVFYDRNSDSSISSTEKNFVKVYADIDKINAVSVPAGLGNINTVIKSYVNTVQDCCQLSIDSANGKITPEETATKAKALADQRRNTSYDYADMVYKYFQSVDVLWESVYGDYILDLLS